MTMKLAEVIFIEPEDVERAHADAIAAFGGGEGLRSAELLLSAVMAPRATWDGAPLYASLAEMAAAYAYGLALNHPFVDGNKRTAFIVALAFLEVNGVALTLGKVWIANMERIAAGDLGRDDLVALLTGEMPGQDPVTIEP
jgi:death-on-curing protein